MKRLAIITKKHKAAAWDAGRALQEWFKERGVDALHLENEPDLLVVPLPPDIELIVVMGGDGTILSVARHYGQKGIPLLGVNVGGLGFLTEVSLDELYPCMERVLAAQYQVEERLMLTATLFREGRAIWEEHVLNDAVINKGALARIAGLTICIDGEYLTTYRADGLIIATPTGSTAYTLSAGGPIVFPTLRHLILLPICPHTLSNRPIILPESVTVGVTLDDKGQDLYLTLDGQVGQTIQPGDRMEVRACPHNLKLVISPHRSYFQILRTKLGWGEIGIANPRNDLGEDGAGK